MKRVPFVLLTLAALVVAMTVPAGAAPSNKNVGSVPLDCGTVEVEGVSFINQANSAAAFDTATGRVLVALGFAGTEDSAFTITDSDTGQQLAAGSVSASFTDFKGQKTGLQDRLFDCSFTEEFEFSAPLTQGDADYLEAVATPGGDYSQYIGETLYVSGTFTGTVTGIMPGA